MRKRVRFKKKLQFGIFKMKKGNFFIYLFLAICLAVFFVFRFADSKVTPVLMNYAELEMRKFSSLIVNQAIAKELTDEINIEELFIITRDSTNEIKTIDFNPLIVSRILTLLSSSIQNNLFYVKEGRFDMLDIPTRFFDDYNIEKLKKGIIFEIPSGIVFSNSLLSNLGPKVPVKLELAGDIVSNIKTKITNYGINNALLEVSIDIQMHEQIILPFVSKKIDVHMNVPIAIKMIQGTVPNYYFNGMNKTSPNLVIPME